MITAAIIIGIVIIAIIISLDLISNNSKTAKFSDGILGGIIISIFFIIEIGIVSDILAPNNPKPTAMDVYQGKTTLEYKVVDDVKVDSCVIFKNNINGTEN
jgi:hypothetical protein